MARVGVPAALISRYDSVRETADKINCYGNSGRFYLPAHGISREGIRPGAGLRLRETVGRIDLHIDVRATPAQQFRHQPPGLRPARQTDVMMPKGGHHAALRNFTDQR
ncbi:hypothetical protein ROLI_004560 [Roseobacter fucihabitans]|uniref:Uncharacterized protein n=1 Tax=Roseobacter fucihabitans TaxID=1537242 RepID=A0ABZ2BMW8_9RHOB|nr:hypothetical protein [Roseobacter litoralis]